LTKADILWVAGLTEGEGYFGGHTDGKTQHRYPQISVGMTDEDTIERLGLLWKRSITEQKTREDRKRVWVVRVAGSKAAGWMMILYPFMGTRRQAAIRKALTEWRKIPNRGKRGKMPTLGSKVRSALVQLVLL